MMKFKELRSNLALKILAIFLSGIMGVLIFFSVADALFVTVMIENHGTYEMARQEVAKTFLNNIANSVGDAYNEYGVNIDSMYENANFYYRIFDTQGDLVHTNYKGEEFWFYDFSYSRHGYNICLYVKDEISHNDNMSMAVSLFDFAFDWRSVSVVITLISVMILIVLLTYLFCSAGHKAGVEGITLNVIDRVPFEIYVSFFAFVVLLEGLFLNFFTYNIMSVAFLCVFAVIDFMLLIGFSLSIATRIKSRTLFTNTIIWVSVSFVFKIIKKIFKAAKYIFNHLPIVWKTALFILTLFVIEIILLIRFDYDAVLFFNYVQKILFSAIILIVAVQFKDIQKAIKRVSKGEVDYKIDTSNLFWDFKESAQDLNNIGFGLSNAVEEKMKSERFKTELITNVSHDIKTPLTSIINYVDLIKKELTENDKIMQYITVLDRQSKRLKKLTDDLVEASKASSGVINVNLKPLDLNVLLVQVVGEYQERMEEQSLQLVVSYPENPVIILADGQHLWRVFDNLMNNILKYAQKNTRVYLSIDKLNENAIVTFKNISKQQLSIKSEELTERFVRGDSSRNTEGSGLGLSIAKSLTELQKGSMKIFVDGDLYKATLTFKLFFEEGNTHEENNIDTNE